MLTHLVAAQKRMARYITRQEEGASLVEYGLLLALIAVVCLAAVSTLGGSISSMLNGLASSI